MKTLILDNYDSFTYNLVHIAEQFTDELMVLRNDEIDLKEVEEFEKIILSPGPGLPSEAGLLIPIIEAYYNSKSILGVCLGLQAIAKVFGGRLKNLKEPMHGFATDCSVVKECALFQGIGPNFEVGHYHSWVVDPDHVPDNFDITAQNKDGMIMAMEHRTLDVIGVQFHPESVLTPTGKQMIKNWMLS